MSSLTSEEEASLLVNPSPSVKLVFGALLLVSVFAGGIIKAIVFRYLW